LCTYIGFLPKGGAFCFNFQLAQISGEIIEESADLVIIRSLARDLISTCQSSPSDSAHLTASLHQAEAEWDDLKLALSEREAELVAREKQTEQIYSLRESVVTWLNSMQVKVDALAPSGIELEVLRHQEDQLMVRKYSLSILTAAAVL